ncbi:MAG: hypothetical protein Q9227_001449 [Pyrenula ochraceoflavens]
MAILEFAASSISARPLLAYYHAYKGIECTWKHSLHARYGSILRSGPNDVDFADGAALAPIYVEKGGFRKAGCYRNFDIDGHPSIFSELVPENRAVRSKAVVAMFSMGAIRSGGNVIGECVERWVARVKDAKRLSMESGRAVDMLNLTRSLATDTVSSYLFAANYGGLDEEGGLSVSGMVDSFVAVGRFFYLPTSVFQWVMWLVEKTFPSREEAKSMMKVNDFVAKCVSQAEKGQPTYPGRLLSAGIPRSETCAQCKDLIFAGTDSTGMNLATICWMLSRDTKRRRQLKQEILAKASPDADLQSLPYLRGVIKEGLRMSLANPSRMPRVVPKGGWAFKGNVLPAGTAVACAPYEMHFNPAVFPDPEKFRPERWDDPSENMMRDHIPFGLGSRQCIARNLASAELYLAVKRIVEEDVLEGSEAQVDRIEILEWFNSKVKSEKIELRWTETAEGDLES